MLSSHATSSADSFKSHRFSSAGRVSLFITCGLTIATAFTSQSRALASYPACLLANHVAHLRPSVFPVSTSIPYNPYPLGSEGSPMRSRHLLAGLSPSPSHSLFLWSVLACFPLSGSSVQCAFIPADSCTQCTRNALWSYTWPAQGSASHQWLSFFRSGWLLSAARGTIFCSVFSLCFLICCYFYVIHAHSFFNRSFMYKNLPLSYQTLYHRM